MSDCTEGKCEKKFFKRENLDLTVIVIKSYNGMGGWVLRTQVIDQVLAEAKKELQAAYDSLAKEWSIETVSCTDKCTCSTEPPDPNKWIKGKVGLGVMFMRAEGSPFTWRR